MTGYRLFDTAIGCCGIAWNERGLVAVQLPEADACRTGARLLARRPEAREALPPGPVAATVERIAALLRGESVDLSATPLDCAGVPDFDLGVYDVALVIPPGRTMTYGEIAERLGDRGLSRAVGQALGRNPWPIVVPCHRVLAAGGRMGGFSAAGGILTKHRLLEIEGAFAADPPSLFGDLPLAIRPRRPAS